MKGLPRTRFALSWLLVAAVFALFAASLRAERVADLPQPTDYVSDFAHVLSRETTARIDSVCSQLDHGQANAKIAVVTVHDLGGDDAADFATQLEDHWQMGDKDKIKGQNRYAMVLLAVADHKYRIEIGYGLEGILPDGKTGDIGRGMVPDLRAGDYDEAMSGAVGQIAQVIADDAHVTLENPAGAEQIPAEDSHRQSSGKSALGGIIVAIVVLIFIVRILGNFGVFGLWGLSMLSGGMGQNRDRWGGGGFGGGGGFSGFGGGGGGFGGGGAGGSW